MLLLLTAFALLYWFLLLIDRPSCNDWHRPLVWLGGVLVVLVGLSSVTPPYIVNEYPLIPVNGYYATYGGAFQGYNFVKDDAIVHEGRGVSFCVGSSTPFIRKYGPPWWWNLISLRIERRDEIHLPSMNYIMPQKPANPIIIRYGGNAK